MYRKQLVIANVIFVMIIFIFRNCAI